MMARVHSETGPIRFAHGEPPDATVITRMLTPEEQVQYGIQSATHAHHKDTSDQAEGIRAALRSGESIADIARQFDVSEARVRGIWGHMPQKQALSSRSLKSQQRDVAQQIAVLRTKLVGLEKRYDEITRRLEGDEGHGTL